MKPEWRKARLGDVVTFQRGFDLPHQSRRRGEIPIVSSAGVMDYHDTAMVMPPSVVTGRYGTIGQVFFVEVPNWPLNTTLFVRNFHGNDEKFVYYLLQRFNFADFSGKSGVPGVNRNDLHAEDVVLPDDTHEQSIIATTLSDVDALLTAQDALIEKKRAIKNGAMQELVTGKRRLPGFSGEWEVKELNELLESPVTDGPHLTPRFLDRGIPFLSVNNLVDGKIDWSDLRYISEKDHREFSKKCRPRLNDILFGKAASVGKVALVETEIEFNIWSPIALVRIDCQFSFRFVYHQLQSKFVEEQVLLLTNSSSQGNIGMSDIERLQICLPVDGDEQIAVSVVLDDLDTEIAALEAKRRKTAMLKQGMMQELLTGKTRLV